MIRSQIPAASCLLGLVFTTTVTAQRFDSIVPMGPLTGSSGTQAFPNANAVTDPSTGVPTIVASDSFGSEHFTWNGTTWVATGIAGPTPAQAEQMAPFSTVNGTGIVYLDQTGNTWVFGGGVWSNLGVLVPSPSARNFAATTNAVDGNGNAFLYGGLSNVSGATLSDLWRFDGSAWTNITPAGGTQPGALVGAALVSDGIGGLLMTGGATTFTGIPTNGVFRFNGTTWSLVQKTPFRLSHHSMVLDISRRQLVVAGGDRFDSTSGTMVPSTEVHYSTIAPVGTLGAWTQVLPGLNATANIFGHTGARDAVHQELVFTDLLVGDTEQDRLASSLAGRSSSPTNCMLTGLQLAGGQQPRIGTNCNFGGLLPAAGIGMLFLSDFPTPSMGLLPAGTPIGGTCENFLSPSAMTVGVFFSGASGVYQMPLSIPASTSFVGLLIDLQAFGTFGGMTIASNDLRTVIGR